MAKPKCLACGSASVSSWAVARDVEYQSTTDEFEYVRCADCDTISIADPPSGRLSEIYPDTYYSFSEGSMSLAERVKQWLDRRMFKKLFAGIQGDSLSALDVGGGTGWLLSQAREVEPRLKNTAVVDIDAQAREGAEKLGHAFHLGRVEDFKTDRKYDLILLLNLIEHVEDPVGVLSKMRELLAPGGRILAKTSQPRQPRCAPVPAQQLGRFPLPASLGTVHARKLRQDGAASGAQGGQHRVDPGRSLLGGVRARMDGPQGPGQHKARPADVPPSFVWTAPGSVCCSRYRTQALLANLPDVCARHRSLAILSGHRARLEMRSKRAQLGREGDVHGHASRREESRWASKTRWAPTASSSSNIPRPTSSCCAPCSPRWAFPRSPGTRARTSPCTARATATSSSMPSPAAMPRIMPSAHGPSACAMAFRVKDAKAAHERALELGATDVKVEVGDGELDIPAIEGIGGSRLFFVDQYGPNGSIYDVDFDFHPDWQQRMAEADSRSSPTSTISRTM